jgi:hypothetical protein
MMSKYKVNHVEYGVLYNWGVFKYRLSIVVNRPITTIEFSCLSGSNQTPEIFGWGISYCRPEDDWNPARGISKAATNLMEQYKSVHSLGSPIAKDFVAEYWKSLEPVICEVNQKYKVATKLSNERMDKLYEKCQVYCDD